MAGVKGRSGRRKDPWKDYSIHRILRQSLEIVSKYLDSPEISPEKKLEVASRFAVRTIPQVVMHDEAKKLTFEERIQLVDKMKELMTSNDAMTLPKADYTVSTSESTPYRGESSNTTETHTDLSTTEPMLCDEDSEEEC